MFWGSEEVGLGRRMGTLSMVSLNILKSLRLAPAMARPTGTPDLSASKLRLTPSLARSVGLGPVVFPPERRFGHRAVHREPSPVDTLELVIIQEPSLP